VDTPKQLATSLASLVSGFFGQCSGLVALFGNTVTYLVKIAVKRLLPHPDRIRQLNSKREYLSWSLLRNVPEGRCDRSMARSAWVSATPRVPSRRVRSDSCRCAYRFDDHRARTFQEEYLVFLGLKNTAHISIQKYLWV
jgi:hypothetical protein